MIAYARRDEIRHGTYAELVSAPIRTVAAKPANASWAEAAGIPLAGLTALQSMLAAEVGPDDTVLVHAAAGGVGHFAVQLGRILGARVLGTASPRNHDFLTSLGAEPVSYGDDLVANVRQVAPDGVDVALDLVGGQALDASFELAKRASRVVSIVDSNTVLGRDGRYVFVRPDAEQLGRLGIWFVEGRLRTHVDRTFPLAESAAALELLQGGHVRGKLAIEL